VGHWDLPYLPSRRCGFKSYKRHERVSRSLTTFSPQALPNMKYLPRSYLTRERGERRYIERSITNVHKQKQEIK